MANVNKPFGLRPIKNLTGAPWNGKLTTYYVSPNYATAMFRGDLVCMSKVTANAEATGKYPSIEACAADGIAVGVVMGFGTTPDVAAILTDLNASYRPASSSTIIYAFVCDDPDVIFEIQEDGTLVAADVGGNGDIVATAGNTSTGISKHVLDSSTVNDSAKNGGTPAVNQLKVLRLANRPDNAIGEYAVWEVMINNHEFRNPVGTNNAMTS